MQMITLIWQWEKIKWQIMNPNNIGRKWGDTEANNILQSWDSDTYLEEFKWLSYKRLKKGRSGTHRCVVHIFFLFDTSKSFQCVIIYSHYCYYLKQWTLPTRTWDASWSRETLPTRTDQANVGWTTDREAIMGLPVPVFCVGVTFRLSFTWAGIRTLYTL